MLEYYPENPEAYFKLWRIKKRDSDESLDVAEKMYLCCTNIFMLETK